MANRWDSDYHNEDHDNINNPILTRVEFPKFHKEAHDENQQFREKSQQIIGEIKQIITTLLSRKSSHNFNDQYIQWRTSNYTVIPFFNEDMC